jgi:hypothetical protein
MIPPLGDPNNHSTWGFWCDTCERFVSQGGCNAGEDRLDAELPSMGIVVMRHRQCGAVVTYVGYRRDEEFTRVAQL